MQKGKGEMSMAGRARNIQVIFRVDEQERGLIRQKMELMGVRNMQAYLRKMAIDGYAVKLDLPELREQWRCWGGITAASTRLPNVQTKQGAFMIQIFRKFERRRRKSGRK